MGVHKSKDGAWEALGYVPKALRKPGDSSQRYLGRTKLKREAEQLVADHKRAMRGQAPVDQMTVGEYADRWLEFKHGPDTRRPRPGTLRHNRQMLTAFLETYRNTPLTGIKRNEALDWCLKHRSAAKTVSAMFNDAINDDLLKANPFANRQQKQMRGRKDITPVTEAEVDLLADIAVEAWGEAYGIICRAWILWSAWVGTRPGETFGLAWEDVDVKAGTVTVARIKPPYNTDTVPVAQKALDALLAMPHRTGPLFPNLSGREMRQGGGYTYYWDRIRTKFEERLEPARLELIREDGKPFALYSLRHYCASIIVASGGNEYDCAAQLGNTPEVCRETYIHEFKSERRERLRGLLDGGSVTPLRRVV